MSDEQGDGNFPTLCRGEVLITALLPHWGEILGPPLFLCSIALQGLSLSTAKVESVH